MVSAVSSTAHVSSQRLLTLSVQRRVDGDHITPAQEIIPILDPLTSDLFRSGLGQRGIIKVKQLGAVERLETLKHSVTDSTASEGTDDFAFEVKRVSGDGGDVPSAVHDLFVG